MKSLFKSLLKIYFAFITLLFIKPMEVKGKVYLIGTDTTYAPFEYVDENGEFVGIDVDLIEAIANDQGFEYELHPIGGPAAIQAVDSGQYDAVLAGVGITPEREKTFDFTKPYYETSLRFAVLEGSFVNKLEDLSGKRVAAKTGTTGADIAKKESDKYNFEVLLFEDSVSMYEDLKIGNSEAVVEDYPVMQYAVNAGRINLKFIGDEYPTYPFGMGVKKGKNEELIEMFNTGLDNIIQNGIYDKIISSYLGTTSVNNSENSLYSILKNNVSALTQGLLNTLIISIVSFAIAFILGLIFSIMRISHFKFFNTLSKIYIYMIRGIPMIVLAFFIYFGIPQILDISINPMVAGIMTVSINAGAYLAEIMRGGILAVDIGQSEASHSLGLKPWMNMTYIVIPQAFKIMIPSFINQFIITLKDTSILSVIGVVELTNTGRIIVARTYQSADVWLIIGVFYLVLITLLTLLSLKLEDNRNGHH